jgi:hypothetical protein
MAININELPPSERLAIEQALFNKLGEDVSTKNPDSLRYAADADMIETYRATGYKSRDVLINGVKVGTHSVRVTKGKDAQTVKRLVVRDPYALEKFIEDNIIQCIKAEEMPYAELYAQAMLQNFAEFVMETYGEVCDGCEVVTETVPAQAPAVNGTTMRIDADQVARALKGYLPTTFGGLLGGAQDE